jgi:hypothetical protein
MGKKCLEDIRSLIGKEEYEDRSKKRGAGFQPGAKNAVQKADLVHARHGERKLAKRAGTLFSKN